MDELITPSNVNLAALSSLAEVPDYDRRRLGAGIVHIGLGNFHRAHQAWYLHRLFNRGLCRDWAVLGAGVRPQDALQRQKLKSQDWLTTLIALDPSGRSVEVVGSMIDFVPVEEGNGALISRMAGPDIRIVSLTITEGGYFIDPASGGFDALHPDVLYDAANPDTPRTAFGAMIAALRLRRDRGHGPFTAQSCDNLQGNGDAVRRTLVSLAKMSDPELAGWIEANCSFPNSVVDCIVPATGAKEIALARSLGIDDASPVTHERFRQWVIEDDFCAGRPDWDKVGATFSDAVGDYEMMKLRILNGGHQILAMAGELLGIETIAGTIAHPLIRQLFEKVITHEIAPHVGAVSGATPLEYLDLVVQRFANPEIEDTTRRVAFDGSSRQPAFLFPSIRDGLGNGTAVKGLALATAMWCKYCEGTREDGTAIEPNDPNWPALQQRALAARDAPMRWLQMRRYYGDLGEDATFAGAFTQWHGMLARRGVETSIRSFLGECHGAMIR